VHNLAPFSQFNNLTFDPPYVMFSANQTHLQTAKDSARNAEQTGFFVWNLATWDLREAVNRSAAYTGPEVDEFEQCGLERDYSRVFPRCPRVKASPVHFDCRYHLTLRMPGNPPLGGVHVVVAEVVGVEIHDDVLTDGLIDVRKTAPIARCGYNQYTVVRDVFDMVIPSGGDPVGDRAMNSGLEGSVRDMRGFDGWGDEAALDGKKRPDKGEEEEEQEDDRGEGVVPAADGTEEP